MIGQTLCGWREGVDRELQRNAEAVSVPHLSVAGRPYTLNGMEERAPAPGIWQDSCNHLAGTRPAVVPPLFFAPSLLNLQVGGAKQVIL